MTQMTSLRSVTPLQVSSRQRLIGIASALMTVLVWSGYFLSLRAGVLSPLGTLEMSLIRYALPGFCLLPIFISAVPAYRQVPWPYLLGIVFGSGWVFFFVSLLAMRQTSVLIGSTLIPGAAPAFVTLLAVVLFRQPFPLERRLGLSLILLGVFGFVAQALLPVDLGQLMGIALLLAAALIWALFTLSVRQSGLAPLPVAALVVVPNGLAVGLWALLSAAPADFSGASGSDIAVQVLFQGLLVGIFSGLFYSTAIRRLGAESTSAIGSATPVVASALALILLHESISLWPAIALMLTASGVLLASRAR